MKLMLLGSIVLLVVLLSKLVAFVVLSRRLRRQRRRLYPTNRSIHPLVSVIVPCYNEDMVVVNCVSSLLAQTYDRLEIILVDDGSTDDTAALVVEQAACHERIRAYTKENGGKADALNYGIERSNGDIIVCMDADSSFRTDTVEHLVRSFEDPTVGAVGGNVRVANRTRMLAKHQTAEYISGLTIQRSAFAYLGCMQVISGAIGAFRRDALVASGGYSSDTIVEDMDVTVTLAKHGYRVTYNPQAIAYTEAPENVKDFFKQRYRWAFGTLEVVYKHRNMMANREYGRMGMVGMPYCMVFPWVDVMVSALLIVAVVRVSISGDGYALLAFYLVLTTIQASVLFYALTLDGEDRRLTFMAVVEHFFYSHVINLATVRAGFNYRMGRSAKWNKLTRLGKNVRTEARPKAESKRFASLTN